MITPAPKTRTDLSFHSLLPLISNITYLLRSQNLDRKCGLANSNYTSCRGLPGKSAVWGTLFAGEWDLEEVHSHYLVTSKGNCDRDIQGLVDHPGDRFDQRHEEKRKPDNADEQNDDHASHAVLHHFLLLLPPGLRVSLQQKSSHKVQATVPWEAGGVDECSSHGVVTQFSPDSALKWGSNLVPTWEPS